MRVEIAGTSVLNVAENGVSHDMSMKMVITLTIMWAAAITKVAVDIITLPGNISRSIQHSVYIHPATYLFANPK